MADSSFDWTSLLGPAANALGSYWAGNQIGNATQQAVQAGDPFAQYRGQAGGQLSSTLQQPIGQRVAGVQGGQWGNALTGFESQPTNQRAQSYYQGPWNQQLNALQQNPNSVAQLPGYQFALNQGVQAIDRNAASRGLLDSGATGKGLMRYGQDYASQQFGNERNFLAGQANNETALNANQGNLQQGVLQSMASQESNLGSQFGLANQASLGQASGANQDPRLTALMGLQGRGGQLGSYNQGAGPYGLGALLGGTGKDGTGPSPLSQLTNSGINAIRNYFNGGTNATAPSNGLMPGYSPGGQGYGLPPNSPGTDPGTYGYGGDQGYGDLMNYDPSGAGADVQAYPYSDPSFSTGSYGAATGAGASAADGSTAYNALASASEGGEGAAAGAGAGGGAWGAAAPMAAVAAWAINDYNKGGETNNAVVNTAISNAGGASAFKQMIENAIPQLLNPNNANYADRDPNFETPSDYGAWLSGGQQGPMPGSYGHPLGSIGVPFGNLFSGKYDTEMNQALGPAVYADLRKRVGDAQTKALALHQATVMPNYFQGSYTNEGG